MRIKREWSKTVLKEMVMGEEGGRMEERMRMMDDGASGSYGDGELLSRRGQSRGMHESEDRPGG